MYSNLLTVARAIDMPFESSGGIFRSWTNGTEINAYEDPSDLSLTVTFSKGLSDFPQLQKLRDSLSKVEIELHADHCEMTFKPLS